MAMGRPRGFDKDQALRKATEVFWRKGYDGASMADLTSAMGINPPSLYAAFGSKAELYGAALQRYEEISDFTDPDSMAEADSPAAAVRLVLEAGVRAVTAADRERGCMVSDGMVACATAHRDIAEDLARRRRRQRSQLSRVFERWIARKEARSLARFVAAVLQGLSIQARDGASPADLRAVVAHACAGLPESSR